MVSSSLNARTAEKTHKVPTHGSRNARVYDSHVTLSFAAPAPGEYGQWPRYLVAIVMMTVRNSLATAFTLVGALSIIRFRTVVKDTRDTAFVFGALALGMAAGLGFWELAALGTVAICALALVLYATNFGALYKSEFILRFTFDQNKDSAAYLAKIAEFAKRSNMLHIEPSGDSRSLRLTYDITLGKDATAEAMTGALSRIDGVSDVVLIVSKNDIDY